MKGMKWVHNRQGHIQAASEWGLFSNTIIRYIATLVARERHVSPPSRFGISRTLPLLLFMLLLLLCVCNSTERGTVRRTNTHSAYAKCSRLPGWLPYWIDTLLAPSPQPLLLQSLLHCDYTLLDL